MLGGRPKKIEVLCGEWAFSFISSCWMATLDCEYSTSKRWICKEKYTYCISIILPEMPDAAKLSLLLQPDGLRVLRLPKNLVFRLGDAEPEILWRSENEVVECAMGSIGLFSPMVEERILVGRRDDWEYLDGRSSTGAPPELPGGNWEGCSDP